MAGIKYEVFISHRGPDTKLSFVDSLVQELKRKHVRCFFDREELRPGHGIKKQLHQAMEDSSIYVIVFSPRFAESSWCNDEVVEAVKAVDRHPEAEDKIIYPVFHGVTPADVRHTYRHSLAGLIAKGYATEEQARVWRSAFARVASISGHEVDLNEQTSVTTGKIASKVFEMLFAFREEEDDIEENSSHGYVDSDGRVESIFSSLEIGAEIVTSVGITGQGGIGKTRLAEEVFNRIEEQFEASCFLANVREEAKSRGLRSLLVKVVRDVSKVELTQSQAYRFLFVQKRLASIKVLLVLDDVESRSQLLELFPPLGRFSRLIVTSRDRDVLKTLTTIHEVDELEHSDAMKLFQQHAKPDAALGTLVQDIVCECKGVPLLLEVAGVMLLGENDEHRWRSIKEKLSSYPGVVDKLRVSLEPLHPNERELFLHICCFFVEVAKLTVCWIWNDDTRLTAEHDIKVLLDKHLLRLDTDGVTLRPHHDLIRDMAREEVRHESQSFEERSRIWNYKDAEDILMRRTGTAKIKTLILCGSSTKVDAPSFKKLKGLQLLNVSKCHIRGDFLKMPYLNYLRWQDAPLDKLPSSILPRLINNKVLDLCGSTITRLWDIDTSEGNSLHGLIELVLDRCRSLQTIVEVEPCKEIRSISLRYCNRLTGLANFTQKLEILDLTGCKSLTRLPDIPSHCRIYKLSLRWCSSIMELPDSIGNLEMLETFDLAGTSFSTLPEAFGDLQSLVHLDISSCKSLSRLPSSFCKLSWLRSLHMFGCGIVELPLGFGELSSLVEINMERCLQLTQLSPDFYKLGNLETLILIDCKKFSMLPQRFEKLSKLMKLDMEGCNLVELPDSFGGLGSLQKLNLAYNKFRALPLSVAYLDKTEKLRLDHCFLLSEVRSLPGTLKNIPGRLQVLDMGDCFQLEQLPDLEELQHLQHLILCNCVNLREIHGIDKLPSLISLNISGCGRLSNDSIPGLCESKALQHLYLSGSKVYISSSELESSFLQLQTISYFSSELTPGCKDQLASSVHLKNFESDHEGVMIKNELLLKETVLGDHGPPQAIVFQIVAHDQGWSDYEHMHGRYTGNSYFEVRVSRDGAFIYAYTIAFNRHADGRDQLHICLFRNKLPEFVDTLKPGDVVSLYGICRFLRWELRVKHANMKLVYGTSTGSPGSYFSHSKAFKAELAWQRWRYTVADSLPQWFDLRKLAAIDLAHTEFIYEVWDGMRVVTEEILNEWGEVDPVHPRYRIYKFPGMKLHQEFDSCPTAAYSKIRTCSWFDYPRNYNSTYGWSQVLMRPMSKIGHKCHVTILTPDEAFQAESWPRKWQRREQRPFFSFWYRSHLCTHRSGCEADFIIHDDGRDAEFHSLQKRKKGGWHGLSSTNVQSTGRVQLVYRDY